MFRMTYHARARGGAWAVDNFRHRFLLVFCLFVLARDHPTAGNPLSAALVNRQTKKDPLAPSQKVLKRHKKRRIDYRCAIAI